MSQPSPAVIAKFVEVVDRLCNYEALQRLIRGRGLYAKSELPIPEVIEVMNWLRPMSSSDQVK